MATGRKTAIPAPASGATGARAANAFFPRKNCAGSHVRSKGMKKGVRVKWRSSACFSSQGAA